MISIVAYNPAWPAEFAREALKIKLAIGNNAIEVHHIGSTSIPELPSKPKLDVITVVRCFNKIRKSIESIGYQYRKEHEIPFRLYFTKRTEPNVNLHVFEENNPEIELNILFRDFLRNSEESRIEYANLKRNLIINRSYHKKNNSNYSGYNLGKNDFIKKIIKQTGFSGICFRPCEHYYEWQEYHRIRREQIFDPLDIIYDEKHPSLTADKHSHFILYKGVEVVTVAHIEFLNEEEVAIRSLATDKPYKMQGYAKYMMQLLEKWIKQQGRKIIKLHANPDAVMFYRKLGYNNMEFDDVSISKDVVDLGKRL